MTYASDTLAESGLLAYFRLGEPSGTTMTDATAAHSGTYTGSPTLGVAGAIAGDADTAVTFSGGDMYGKVAAWTTIPTPPITLECWFKVTASSTWASRWLGGWLSAAGVLSCQFYTSDQTNIRIGFETGNANSNQTLNDGNWHHVVGTHDGTNARLYYDGLLVAGPTAVTFSGGASANPFKVGVTGADSDESSFPGTIDEWAVYSVTKDADWASKRHAWGLANIVAKSVGAWAANNATTQTVTLPTHHIGDMLIVRAGCKPYSATPHIDTSGWAQVAAGFADGSTANGDGVGSVKVIAFYKIAASAAETNPVITWDTTSAPGAAVAVCYKKPGSLGWITPTGAGGGMAAATSLSGTIGSHIAAADDDILDFFTVVRDDTTLTVPTVTQTGLTLATVVEYPAAALTSVTSNDIAADGGYRLATAGTSSAAAVVTGTASTSESGAAWTTRLRAQVTAATGTFAMTTRTVS